MSGPDHPYVAACLTRKAQMYNSLGEYVDAEPLYERALSVIKKDQGDDTSDVAALLESLSKLHEDMGKTDAADNEAARAKEIRENLVKKKDDRGG